jgi:hypothetical protein
MSMGLVACATQPDPATAEAAQMPLGDWWPNSPSAAAVPMGRSETAPAEYALGDWWPDRADVLAAAAPRNDGRPVARNDR